MKHFFTAVILGVTLAGIAFAPSAARAQRADGSNRTKVAVVEFTPGPNASAMTDEAKRSLQTNIAAALVRTAKFDVVDVRHTRNASQANLPSINGDGTAAAVQVGKQLGASYVLTGTVVEYNTTSGQVTMKTRLIEVATGQVRHSGQTAEQSASEMTARAGDAEMMAKVLKPAIKKLAATLAGE